MQGGCVSECSAPQVVASFAHQPMDGGDPAVPPQFECEECRGVMTEYYKGVHGHEYRIENERSNRT